MPNDESSLTLHMHPLASYCWKVPLALYEARTSFQTVQVHGVPKDNKAYAELWPTASSDHSSCRDTWRPYLR
jgi:glutathione S-transferase